MKYFAILKDSFREILDSKVLLVLLILSTLVIGAASSLGFKKLSAEETYGQFFSNSPGMPPKIMYMFYLGNFDNVQAFAQWLDQWLRSPNSLRVFACKLEKVENLSGGEDLPASDYALTIQYRSKLPQQQSLSALKGEEATDLGKAKTAVHDLFHKAEEMGFVQVGEISQIINNQDILGTLTFKVTMHGTGRTVRVWAAEPSFGFGFFPMDGAVFPLGLQIYFIANIVIGFGAWIAILLGVIITSFFVPNMLRKGTIDMLLVKPIHRWALLVYKYVGGLIFILVPTAYGVGGIAIVLGIRSGLWGVESLLLVLTITFFFAILYSVSTFVAVATRNTIAAILVTIAFWVLCFLIGWAEARLNGPRKSANAAAELMLGQPEREQPSQSDLGKVFHVIQRVIPRNVDLDHLNDMIAMSAYMSLDIGKKEWKDIAWGESFAVSMGWIAFFLGLACWRFSKKDY